jgi:hypothetical protein
MFQVTALPLAVAILFVSGILWKLYRILLVKSPLHHLAGPPRASLITGVLSSRRLLHHSLSRHGRREPQATLQSWWVGMARRNG